MRFIVTLTLLLCLGATAANAADACDNAEAARLHALFDADWEWAMHTFPE